jgi:protein TonB
VVPLKPLKTVPLSAPVHELPPVVEPSSQATVGSSQPTASGLAEAPGDSAGTTSGNFGGAPGGPSPGDGSQPIIEPRYDVAYLNNARPTYPAMARRLKLEGITTLRVLVSREGNAQSVTLHNSSGVRVLDEAALAAVQRWAFVPARQGDKPIAAEVDVPVRFRLDETAADGQKR